MSVVALESFLVWSKWSKMDYKNSESVPRFEFRIKVARCLSNE